MNTIFRSVIKITVAVSACLITNAVYAYQLGNATYVNGIGGFEIHVPVVDLERDAGSKLTGTVYSRSAIVDSLEYRVENLGEDLKFVARSNHAATESFSFVIEISYRGMTTGRRYEFVLDNDRTRSEQSTSFSLTPGEVESFVPKASFNLDLKHTTHVVESGQSLWDIAVDCEEIGGNNFQRSLAIFAANQNKFVNGDINLLSVDTTLVIPKQSYVDMFSPSDAASVFYKLATGALAVDAAGRGRAQNAPEPTQSGSLNSEPADYPSIEMASSREIPTEQAMLARRIESLETRVQALASENRSLMQAWRTELEQRIELLESSRP